MIFLNLAIVIVGVFSLGVYVQRTRKIYNQPDHSETPPILKFTMSLLFVIMAALGFSVPFAPFWIHVVRIVAFPFAMLLSYSGNRWLVTGQEHLLRHSTLALTTAILIMVDVALGYLNRHNLGLIFTSEPFQPTVLYYAHYGLLAMMLLCLYSVILWWFWRSLYQSQDIAWLTRRLIGMLAYLSLAVCSLLAVLNLILYLFFGETYRQTINHIYLVVSVFAIPMPIISLVPQRRLVRLVKPFEQHRLKRREEQYALLDDLHRIMTQIVPGVQLRRQQLHTLRVPIEISHARQIIWSYTTLPGPITAKNEAVLLHTLISFNVVLHMPGQYQPPPTRLHAITKHNLAVAKHLIQLNTTVPTKKGFQYGPK